jgi:hypothetical protein
MTILERSITEVIVAISQPYVVSGCMKVSESPFDLESLDSMIRFEN